MAQQRTGKDKGSGKSKSRPAPPRPSKTTKKKSRFRLGALVGLAIGYVLGAKAGRARYEQIQSWARRLGRSEPAQQISDEARVAASRAGEALEHKASESVSRITDRVRRTGGDSDPVAP